uniref:C-type lectin domain-containing protein n=1 Tax=Pygocentrus nattereri TaxID=42514 RepID=A0A3B4EH41_PYGNA
MHCECFELKHFLCEIQIYRRHSLYLSLVIVSQRRETLLSSIRNLTEERDQLKSSYQILTEEKEKIQNKFQTFISQTEHEQILLKCICVHHSVKEKSCFEDWKKHKNSFYFFSTEHKSWSAAREDCRERGADLVIINSRVEQVRENFWIGLTDENTENMWKWVDGQTLTDKFWKNNEPNNAGVGGEDCAVFTTALKDSQQTWNDLPCSGKENWICVGNIPQRFWLVI